MYIVYNDVVRVCIVCAFKLMENFALPPANVDRILEVEKAMQIANWLKILKHELFVGNQYRNELTTVKYVTAELK